MKLTIFLGLFAMILLCFIGFTQNEFITETNTISYSSINFDQTHNTVNAWDVVNLDIIVEGDILSP